MGLLCVKEGCNKEFDSKKGMKIHHALSHDEKISFQEVECYHCGETVKKRDAEVKRTAKSFCDAKCKQEEFSSRQAGESNPLWDENVSKNEHTCQQCGDKYENYRESDETVCCSRECYSEWMSETRTGEDAYAWSGGRYFYYGPSWQKQRKRCLESADYECERCGMGNDKHKEEFHQSLHVHHIEKFKKFGLEEHEEANRQENLMAVCRDCHYKVERKS